MKKKWKVTFSQLLEKHQNLQPGIFLSLPSSIDDDYGSLGASALLTLDA